jgi:hypothetical protein
MGKPHPPGHKCFRHFPYLTLLYLVSTRPQRFIANYSRSPPRSLRITQFIYMIPFNSRIRSSFTYHTNEATPQSTLRIHPTGRFCYRWSPLIIKPPDSVYFSAILSSSVSTLFVWTRLTIDTHMQQHQIIIIQLYKLTFVTPPRWWGVFSSPHTCLNCLNNSPGWQKSYLER